MKNRIMIGAVAFSMLFSSLFAGVLYTNATYPVTATGSNAVPTKIGKATNISIFWLITFGDASIKAATEEAGIKEVVFIDTNLVTFPFGLLIINTTEVSGR